MTRFRPNVVVTGAPPWAEDRWRRIRIGTVPFRVVKPCGRCVVTTTDQVTGERGKQPLRMLGQRRRFGKELVFGQNMIPDAGGLIRVGDPVEILEAALPAEPYRFSRDTSAERSAAAGSSGRPIERQPMCLSGRTSSAPSSATSRIRAQS
jgi:hypothetical protein